MKIKEFFVPHKETIKIDENVDMINNSVIEESASLLEVQAIDDRELEAMNNNIHLSEKIELLLLKIDEQGAVQQSLQEEFQSKLKYDQHKEKIIDDLHRELQGYKNDILKKAIQPLVLDIINTIDNINKVTWNYRNQKNVPADKLLEVIEAFSGDLEDVLYRQGIESYKSQEAVVFNGNRQKILKIIETAKMNSDKLVADTLKKGYEWDGKIIRPEMVSVYAYKEECQDEVK